MMTTGFFSYLLGPIIEPDNIEETAEMDWLENL